MIITRILFIFLLLLTSSSLQAKGIDVTFEVFHAQNKYIDIAREKALTLQEKGFKCYIVKGKKNLSVRCNDAKTTKEMQRVITRLNKKGVKFTILNRDTKTDVTKYRTMNQFYLGYEAFNRKEYQKALEIFEYNYKKENTYEHAYAYALALMKKGRYREALGVLKEYRGVPKGRKLYDDIATTYMYKELNKKNYLKAHEIVDKYRFKSKKLHTLINKQEVNDLIKTGEYENAKLLAQKYNLKSQAFMIDYQEALDLQKVKNYQGSNAILAPYISTHAKAKELFFANLVADASLSFEAKNYKKALDMLRPYKSVPKVKKLYDEILYNRSLDIGWSFVDKDPKAALVAFKESCRIQKEYSCYSGMMYSYYNLKMYDKSLYLADKLYTAEPSDELSTLAMRSALKREDYEEAKKWFDRTKNKKGLTSPYLLETFLTIDDYIKLKEYDEAENIVAYLKNLYPENVDVLKREMQVYLEQKEYDKAQDVAEKILLLDPESVEAKYTFALYEFEHEDYNGCFERLSKLTLAQDYQKELFYRCSAYTKASNKNINGAIKAIERVEDPDIKAAFYMDIGDMYRSIGSDHAIRAYKEAKKYKEDDFGLEMVYLYTLQEFMKDDLLDKELPKVYEKYPHESVQLDKFRLDYEKDRLYSYYKYKRYPECYNYAELIQEEQDDIDVYRMGGWCAYSLGKYKEAKEQFATINRNYGESNEDIYAYALSAYQLNETQRAVDALDRITTIEDEKEAHLIANLYTDLEEQEKARAILVNLDESEQRDSALENINKSYTVKRYENQASIGMYYQSQTGIEGKSRFEKFTIPLDYDYVSRDYGYHLYFDGDLMYLYNGYLEQDANAYLDYGLGTSIQDDALASDVGFMPKLGIDYKNFRAEIGSTPIGAKIVPEFTWLLSGSLTSGNWRGSVKLEQKEIDETMLSFVGERARDGAFEANWGRVVKRGIDVGVGYDAGVALSLNLAYYPEIYGLNVINNSEKKATAMALYRPKVESIAYVDVGALIAFDSYDKNTNFFTYGHGGYFSPQQFFLGTIFTQFGDIIGKDFYYQAKFGLGFEGFIVEDSYKFPLRDGVINSGEIQKGYRDGGIVYKAAVQLGYKINQNLDLVSGIAFEQINGYTVQQATFALVYRFEKSRYATLNTFGLNHRVDQIIK